MFVNGPQLAALALVLAAVAPSLPCVRSLEVGLCIGTTLFLVSPNGALILFRPYSTIDAAASARAIRDINNLNCTMIGDGCEDLISLPGDSPVSSAQPRPAAAVGSRYGDAAAAATLGSILVLIPHSSYLLFFVSFSCIPLVRPSTIQGMLSHLLTLAPKQADAGGTPLPVTAGSKIVLPRARQENRSLGRGRARCSNYEAFDSPPQTNILSTDADDRC